MDRWLRQPPRWPDRGFFARAAVALLCLLLASVAFADPPARVGRLADIEGSVWIYSLQAGEWVQAERNRPTTTDDRLSTDADGRAEIRIGSTTLRIGPRSEIELLQLDDERTNVQVHAGSIAARLRTRAMARAFEVTTAEGHFQLDRAGSYRFDRTDDVSHATVWSGQLLFEAGDNAVTVMAGQRGEFWKDGGTQYTLTEPWHDAFETWARAGDADDDRSAATRYVSPEMTGVEDLDRYGRWEQSTDYGPLWIPRQVAPGWVPYGAGRWTWVRPWGWTWVDDAPWGFAPFHYGRWVFHRNAWCWSPGTWVAQPVFAPALVGWIGGSNFSLSIALGGGPAVGWFPLAPHEVFVPTYAVSPRYVRNVNVTQVKNIINVTQIINNPQAVVDQGRYLNRRLPHAVTVVPAEVLERRRPVAPAAAQVRAASREGRGVREMDRGPVGARALAAPPVPEPVHARRSIEPGLSRLGSPNAIPPLPARAATPGAAPGRVGPGTASPQPRMTGERGRLNDVGERPGREANGDRRDAGSATPPLVPPPSRSTAPSARVERSQPIDRPPAVVRSRPGATLPDPSRDTNRPAPNVRERMAPPRAAEGWIRSSEGRERMVPPTPAHTTAPAPRRPDPPAAAFTPNPVPPMPLRVPPRELPVPAPVRPPPEVVPPRPPGLRVPRPTAPVAPAAIPVAPAITPIPRATTPVRPAIIPTPGAMTPQTAPQPRSREERPRSVGERPQRGGGG